MLIIFFVSFLARSLSFGEKIDAKIDIALVIAKDRASVEKNQIRACEKLMTYFETGEDATRFALAALVSRRGDLPHEPSILPYVKEYILMNFTGDRRVHSKVLANVTMPSTVKDWNVWDWAKTIHLVREAVISNSPPGRLKAVIIFLTFFGNVSHNRLSHEGQLLRDTGAWVYVITKNGSGYDEDDHTVLAYVNNLTANPGRTIFVGHTAKSFDDRLVEAMDRVKKVILRDLCQHKGSCIYKGRDGQQCEKVQHHNNPELCALIGLEVPAGTACSIANCDNECDRRWPWMKKPVCKDKCGEKAHGMRNGSSPPAMMENCPKWTTCPPCAMTRAHPPATDTDSSLVGLIIGMAASFIPLLIMALVAIIVTEKRKAAAKKSEPSDRSPSSEKKMAAPKETKDTVPVGKEATVGGAGINGTDSLVAPDLSAGLPRNSSKVDSSGRSSIKVSSKMDAGESKKGQATGEKEKSAISTMKN